MIHERDNKGRIVPKMRAADTRNAWMLYQSGYSTGWIAERIHQRYGYKNAAACQASLFRAFRGRPTRNHKQAAVARWKDGRCVGCGCVYDVRTKGCDSCSRRHTNANRAGQVVAPNLQECSACAGPLSDRTAGCRICRARHSARVRRANRRAVAAEGSSGPRHGGHANSPVSLPAAALPLKEAA